MAKIEIGRYSEQLRRMLGMKGTIEVAGELSPEISPTIQLEGESAEWDFLKGVRGCICATSTAGAVGFTTRFRLRNPVGSAVIATVRLISMTTAASAVLEIARNQIITNFPFLTETVVLDPRWEASGVTGRTTLVFSVDNTSAVGAVGNLIAVTQVEPSVAFQFKEEVILTPGTNLDWASDSPNVLVRTFALWKERQLPALEA